MANILITSFGNGKYDKETGAYDYDVAEYFDVESGASCQPQRLIIPAMHELYNIDKTVLIGTAGSNWPLLYKEVMEERSGFVSRSRGRDDDYYALLEEYHRKSRGEFIPIKEMQAVLGKLKEELGDSYPAICLLEYGITPEEQRDNFGLLTECILGIIEDGDNIYFDITHAFRTLPIYALLVVQFIQQQRKNVSIEMISYGMLDATDNEGYGGKGKTPLIDVSPLAEIVGLISAMAEYNTAGTAYQLLSFIEKREGDIARLLDEELRGSAGLLRLLGEAVTVSDIERFEELVREIKKIKNDPSSMICISNNLKAVDMIFTDIYDHFAEKIDNRVALHFAVAEWHIKYRRYMQAALSCYGAILLWFDDLFSEEIKSLAFWDENRRSGFISKVLGSFNKNANPIQEKKWFSEFHKNFFALRDIRVAFSHPENHLLVSGDTERLPELIGYFADLYTKGGKGNTRDKIMEIFLRRAGERCDE